jgi:hypothetical protein
VGDNMATVNDTDIQSIEDWISLECDDNSLYTPSGYTLNSLIASIAPKCLDLINSKIGHVYSAFESPLVSEILTILTYLTWAEIQYFAYRKSLISEKTWADVWWERSITWLDAIAEGKMIIPSSAKKTNASPAFYSQPIQFTLDENIVNDNDSAIDLDDIL